MDLDILRPFGPSIVKLHIPQEIIFEMNRYTDDIINDKNKSTNFDHRRKLVGNVHQEILLDIDFMKKIDWGQLYIIDYGKERYELDYPTRVESTLTTYRNHNQFTDLDQCIKNLQTKDTRQVKL